MILWKKGSSPFDLLDIFNHLNYHSSQTILMAHKSFEDYRLFDNEFLEELTNHLL